MRLPRTLKRCLVVFAYILALSVPVLLLHQELGFAVEHMNMERLMRRGPFFFSLYGLPIAILVLALVLMTHASLRWFRKPSLLSLTYLLPAVSGLGTLMLWACFMILFFNMPGNGGC